MKSSRDVGGEFRNSVLSSFSVLPPSWRVLVDHPFTVARVYDFRGGRPPECGQSVGLKIANLIARRSLRSLHMTHLSLPLESGHVTPDGDIIRRSPHVLSSRSFSENRVVS